MSKQTFITICIGWSICVVVMCTWLYRTAKGQDKEEDWNEALVDNAVWDFRKKYSAQQVRAAFEGTQSIGWQDNAREAEALSDTWDSGDAA